jgi:glycosyltransferase involved in cell wall biosynthesis
MHFGVRNTASRLLQSVLISVNSSSATKRYRILLGHFSEEEYADGSMALNDAFIRGLGEVADVSLVVTNYWGKRRPGPLVAETTYNGLPALILRPHTPLAFDLTERAVPSDGVAEGRYLSQCIANFAIKQKIDLMHILQWGHLKGCLFEGALRAKIPFIHRLYDYWAVCPQAHLMQHGRIPCDGPDEYGRKCAECMSNWVPIPQLHEDPPYPTMRKTFWQQLPQRIAWRWQRLANFELAMRFFGPHWAPVFGSTYAMQWEFTYRLRALRYYLARAACIVAPNPVWAQEISRHLRIPLANFRICSAYPFITPEKLPKGDRFQPPIQFGHPHRISWETGTFFVLDAWRRARVSPTQGILNIYGQDGGTDVLRRAGYADLISSGSVVVHEGRIANRLDEVFMPLAAVISCVQWENGGSGNLHAIARGVPNIATRWDYPGYEQSSILRDGINGLTFKRGDIGSLAEVIQKCVQNPSVLERMYDTCELPPGFTFNDFVRQYMEVYDEVTAKS